MLLRCVVLVLIFNLFVSPGSSYVLKSKKVGKGACHENDIAKTIVVHVPETEMPFLTLHPESRRSFTSAVHTSDSRINSQKKKLKEALESLNGTVYFLKDVLLAGTEDKNSEAYRQLLEQASNNLKYDCSLLLSEFEGLAELNKTYNGTTRDNINKKLSELYPKISEEYQENYKKEVLGNLSAETLFEILINRPTVILHIKSWFIALNFFAVLDSTISLNPHASLYCLRDQQITTKNGIFLLKHIEIEGQQEITQFAFKKLGYHIIGELQRGYALGSNFIPLGDIALIGHGIRTTNGAIHELMEKNAFGTAEVAVVRNLYDSCETRNNLDQIFNVLDDKNVLVLNSVLDDPKKRRYVDLYSIRNESGHQQKSFGPYKKIATKIEFAEFLRSRGFNITTVNEEEQRNFATNFLNIGNGTIVTSYGEASFVNRLTALGINVKTVYIKDLVGDNVGVHSITQVIYRKKSM